MDAHNQWLKKGFDDGAFLLAGSLQPALGGGILAQGVSIDEVYAVVSQDPFVKENVVTAEVFELDAKKADERLQFLLES